MERENDEKELIKREEELKVSLEKIKKEITMLRASYDASLDENLQGDLSIQNSIREKVLEQRKILEELAKIKALNSSNDSENNKTEEKEEESKNVEEKVESKKEENKNVIDESEEPTVELPVNDIKEKLNEQEEKKSEVKEELKEQNENNFENLTIKFNGREGRYEVRWKQNGQSKEKFYYFDKTLLDEKNENTKALKSKYGEYRDLNIEKFSKDFDAEFGVNLKEKVDNKEIGVVYDFSKLSSLKFLDRKEKKLLKKNAKSYQSENDKNIVVGLFNKKKAAVAAMLGITLVAGGNAMSSKITSENEQKSSIKYEQSYEKTVSTEKDIAYDNTQEKTTEKDDNKITEEVVVDAISKDEEEKQKTKVGDKLELENIELYHSSLDPESRGNTDGLNCDKFEINAISVTYGSEVIEVVRNDSTSVEDLEKKYEEIYGPEIRISVNVHGIDKNGNIIYRNAGWVDTSDLNNTNENVKTK